MFPSHKGNELFFSVSSNNNHQYKITQDLTLINKDQDHASLDATASASNYISKRKSNSVVDNDEISSDHHKKMMHRDIERQRRQDMATLYASLRSLLPLEFIKGKRSTSDQMNEAVNYIKHLERRIKELGVKKDELKKLSNLSACDQYSESGSGSGSSGQHKISTSCVIVRPCLVGVEILLSCGLHEQGSSLSRVLEILNIGGLCVVNCVSTRVNERLLHTIQTEVDDPSSFDLCELQQKLTQVK